MHVLDVKLYRFLKADKRNYLMQFRTGFLEPKDQGEALMKVTTGFLARGNQAQTKAIH